MPATIAVTDAGVFFSPYNWYSDGAGVLQSNNVHASSTYAKSNTPGAYLKTSFSGTSCKVNVDVTPLTGGSVAAGDYPAIGYRVDGAAQTRYQLLSSDTQITVATGLASGSHTLQIDFLGVMWNTKDRWTTPVMVLKVTGLELDTAASVTAPRLPGRMVVFGNSNTEGHEAVAAGVSVAHQDASVSYARLLATLLHCEVGIVGFAGQGIDTAVGTANVPALTAAWNLYAAGQSRLVAGRLSPDPDYLVCNHGINDSGDITTSATSLISAWRTAAPTAPILITVPWTGVKVSQFTAAVAAAADANTYLLNTGVTSYGSNGTHLSTAGHSTYATDLFALAPAVALGRFSGVFASVIR